MPLDSADGCLGTLFEGLAECFPSTFFGWIGRWTVFLLSFGLILWATDDWRAVTTGVVVFLGLVAGILYLLGAF